MTGRNLGFLPVMKELNQQDALAALWGQLVCGHARSWLRAGYSRAHRSRK